MTLGIARDIRFETPLMWLNKAETRALADYYHQLDRVHRDTLTCYNGIKGDGCGECRLQPARQWPDAVPGQPAEVMAALKQKAALA